MEAPADFKLQTATNSDQLAAELERFIAFWLSPRQAHHGEPDEVLDGYRLPKPLRHLYAFAGRWTRPSVDVEEEVPIFSVVDHLRSLDQLKRTPDGRLIFLDENQGNWSCATLPEGDDPPVWVNEVADQGAEGTWELVTESLSQFLVTFCLKELLFGSERVLFDKGLERLFESTKAAAIPLWIDRRYPGWAEGFSFYLFHESIVVGDLGGGIWFGANDEKGIRFLDSHQGEIRGVGLSLEFSWSLDIKPDGSASITLADHLESTALIPPGLFSFEMVRDHLLAACAEASTTASRWYATFPRSGQTSCSAIRFHDTGLAESLFRQALQGVVSKEPRFDELWSKFPLR